MPILLVISTLQNDDDDDDDDNHVTDQRCHLLAYSSFLFYRMKPGVRTLATVKQINR